MSQNSLRNTLLITFAIAFFAMVFVHSCSNKDSSGSVIIQKDTAMFRELNGIRQAFNKTTEVTNGQLKLLVASNDSLTKMVKAYKKVLAVVEYKTDIHIKDSLRFNDSIPCSFSPIPVTKSVPSQYEFKGHITNKLLFIDDLHIPNKTSIVFGTRKPGIFKSSSQEVSIVHSNQLLKTSEIQGIVIRDNKKWYEKPITWLGVGTIAGAASILILTH